MPDVDEQLTDAQFLVNADPVTVRALLPLAVGPEARLSADVYRTSELWHREATADVRRQLLALDATRWGATRLAEDLDDDSLQWKVVWATGFELDPRLDNMLACVPVDAWATIRVGDRPIVVTVGREHYECTQQSLHDCEAKLLRGFDAVSGEQLYAIGGVGDEYLAVLDVDAQAVAITAGREAPVRLWSVERGVELGRGLYDHIHCGRRLAAGRFRGRPIIATVGKDGLIRAWELPLGRSVGAEIDTGPAHPVFGPRYPELRLIERDGRTVVVASDQAVRMWDLATGEPLSHHDEAQPEGERRLVTDEPHVVLTATPRDRSGNDMVIQRWDMRRAARAETATSHAGHILAVAVLDGVVVTAGEDGTVRRWSATDGRPIGDALRGHTGPVRTLDVATVDGRPVAITGGGTVHGGPDETLRRWDLADGVEIDDAIVAAHGGETLRLATTVLDGRAVAVSTGNDDRIALWDLATGAQVGEQTGEDAAIGVIDGRPVVAITYLTREPFTIWDLASSSTRKLDRDRTSGDSMHAVVELDGRGTVTTSGWNTLRRWDIADGIQTDVTDSPHFITAVVVQAPLAAVARIDGTVQVLNLSTGTEIGPAFTLPKPSWAMAFDADGDLIVAFGAELARIRLTGPE